MKTSFLGVLAILVILGAPSAHAVGTGALPIRRILNSSPVVVYQYSQLVASTAKGIHGLQINNTSPHALKFAFGGSGSEVDQLIVGSFEDTAFLPLQGGYATRLSVISLDNAADTGEINVNVFFN